MAPPPTRPHPPSLQKILQLQARCYIKTYITDVCSSIKSILPLSEQLHSPADGLAHPIPQHTAKMIINIFWKTMYLNITYYLITNSLFFLVVCPKTAKHFPPPSTGKYIYFLVFKNKYYVSAHWLKIESI